MSAASKAQVGAELRRRAEQYLAEGLPAGAAADDDSGRLLHELQVHQIELELQNDELQQSRREALAALQRYTELYDLAPVAYFTLAHDGGILHLNPAGAALLGAERASLVGQRFGAFVADGSRTHFKAFMSGLAAGAARLNCELALEGTGDAGQRRIVRIEATAYASGRSINAVASDITAIRDAEDERERYRIHLEEMLAATAAAREAAEQASRAKTEFLTTIGHELRNPLANLMLMAQILSGNVDGNLNARQLEYARIIEEAGKDLLHFVDDLLDLAHIESGSLSVDMRQVLFPDLLAGVHRTYREIARQKGLEFDMQIDADVPQAIVTDAARLQQLLRNLIGNAIKFTRRGSVRLHVRRAVAGTLYGQASLDQAAAVIAFDVADTGIGIASERLAGIFDASLPGANGTGFGLPIARRIARLLGGDLALTSTAGKGSTFTVYLPLDSATAP